jgi:hypothetical protein
MLDRRGGELFDTKAPPPVTVPALSCLKVPVVDEGAERREIADKFAEHRTIRAGVECWQAISTVNTFEAWTKIAKAGRTQPCPTSDRRCRPCGTNLL